jgi:pimeloyl-ACP methyl ester carboxylesterase
MAESDIIRSNYKQHGKHIKLTHGKTYYQLVEVPGSNKHPVVLIHGITWWSFSLDAIVPVLLNLGHSVLTFDLYGRGESDSPSVTHHLKLFVEQTRELVDLVFPKQKIIIGGLSMGGAIASGFLSLHPEYVSQAIIMCPAGLRVPMPDIVNFLSIPVIGWLGFKALGKSNMITLTKSERLSANFYQIQKMEESGLIDGLIKSVIWQIEHKEGFLDAFHSTICNFPFNDMLPYLENIDRNTPILLLWGDKDRMCQGSDLFIKAVPHAELATVKDCGHAFLYEDIDQVEKYIIPFLSKD